MEKKKSTIVSFTCFVITVLCGRTYADVTYILGDIDGGIYDGVGSIDDVYADPVWVSMAIYPASTGSKSFDISRKNSDVFFTFSFTPSVTTTDAWLQVAIKSDDIYVTTDIIALEDPSWITYEDLGWLPVSSQYVQVRTLDLSDVLGVDFLPELLDGQLNVRLADDVLVDFAVLTFGAMPVINPEFTIGASPVISPIPAPGALILGSIGAGLVGWLRKRRIV